MSIRIVIVGNGDPIHVGHHLNEAGRNLGFGVSLFDVRQAFDGPWLSRKWNWWIRNRRPAQLEAFAERLLDQLRKEQPQILIATGIAPIPKEAVSKIHDTGVVTMNYLTDDPWNRSHRSSWFLDALPQYDFVFNPRRINLSQLADLGCKNVHYLPFAYNPEIHYPVELNSYEAENFGADVVFAGGADKDRVPYISTLIKHGYNVALYGGYWDRFPETRSQDRGHADMTTLRRAISGSKISLCLVRRGNRDGHSMRTFEVSAMGGCLLTEETDEHRAIFGEEGECVLYFGSIDEMLSKTRWLLDHESERKRLSRESHKRITTGHHTYGDRLEEMLHTAGLEVHR